MNFPDNFKKNVDFSDGCWLWKAYKIRGRYGLYNPGNKKTVLAHRYSWMLVNGEIPNGLYVLHKCDVPSCVNPDHLFLGTQQDNMDDMVEKGRQGHTGGGRGDKNGTKTHPEAYPRGEDHWSNKRPELVLRGENHWSKGSPESVPRGEKHWNCKLTGDQIVEIRNLYQRGSKGEYSQYGLAKKYGVNQSQISDIVNNKKWKIETGKTVGL